MKTLIAIVSLLVAFSANAETKDEWTKNNTKAELVFATAMFLDYGQTKTIKNNPYMSEHNPILGRHPSDVAIRNYFLLTTAGHYAIAKSLPAGWPRNAWQYGWIGIEVGMVIKNKRVGATFEF